MADEQKTNPETTNVESEKDQNALHMESVERISKLPVVESTINAATNMYEKVKDSNTYINYALQTAESTVQTAVEKITPLAQPVVSHLEGPIKKVDSVLCTGLDYVETKVPCVKLPPGQMYENTKNYINTTVQPAVQTAKEVVQPAVETAFQVKDQCVSKVGEYLGKTAQATNGDTHQEETKDKTQ